MDESDSVGQRMTFCAICGEPTITDPAMALLTVRAPSGRTAIFAAHAGCIIGVFHPKARASLDAAPIVLESD